MTPEQIERIVKAHEKLADAATRIADALGYRENAVSELTAVEGLIFQLSQIESGLNRVAEALEDRPEQD